MTNELNYKVEIVKLSEKDGGGYLAHVPKLPGCMSDGETPEEASKNIQDAIKCWIETAKELGREIPEFDEYKYKMYIEKTPTIKGKYAKEILQDFFKRPSDAAIKRNKSALELVKKLKG
jgi:predicted RNase H-like HicB family nuclease